MLTKICSRCKLKKSVDQFYKRAGTKDGLRYVCKVCCSENAKTYRQVHKEQIKEEHKKYRKDHKKERKEYDRKRYQNNKEKILEQTKKYRQEHKKELNLYFRNRRKMDINYKIACNLRIRLWDVLKGCPKLATTVELTGCSIEFLRDYLQKQFKSDMNWKNYGKWEIDHIRPCASFDLSKPSEQKKCFNYKNLQPLWTKENRSKSAKFQD